MKGILEKIPLISDISFSHKKNVLTLRVGNCRAQGCIYQFVFVLSLLIKDNAIFSISTVRYLTLLLASHPKIHDYAIQYRGWECWLWCSYNRDTPLQILEQQIETHLALTRYFQRLVMRLEKNEVSGSSEK